MKRLAIVAAVLLAAVLLIPVPSRMRDGGTVHYNAILYDVYSVHRLLSPREASGVSDPEFADGIIIELLGTEIYNGTVPYVPSH